MMPGFHRRRGIIDNHFSLTVLMFGNDRVPNTVLLDKRRVRKSRVLVFQWKRSYTHLNDNGYSGKGSIKTNGIKQKKYGER